MRCNRQRGRRARRIAAISVAAGIASHCSTCPPPDADAFPQAANPLELDSARPDALSCTSRIFREPGPDCFDHYRVSVPQKGTLEVRIAPRPGTHPPSAYRLALLGSDLRALARETGAPGDSVLVRTETGGGTYYAAVAVPQGALDYEIIAHLVVPVIVIREPQFRTVVAAVVELEGPAGGEQAVLLDGGEAEGLRPGQKGQLLDGDRVLGELEIVKVFPGGGSRAQIQGRLGGVVSAETRAEFQVPVDDP